jgi:tetratricopeptide (TPR) repeat protein
LRNISVFIFFMFVKVCLAQKSNTDNPAIIGKICRFNSGRKPLFFVQIRIDNNLPKTNNSNGDFTCAIPEENQGQKVVIHLSYRQWKVINALDTIISIPEITDTLYYYMCTQHQIDSSRVAYYNISLKYLEDSYVRKLKDYQKKSDSNWQEKIALLNQEKDNLEKKIVDISNFYSTYNTDEITQKEKKAISLFFDNKIDDALKLLLSIPLDSTVASEQKILNKLLENQEKVTKTIKVTRLKLKKMATEYREMGDLFLVKLNSDSAEIYYSKAVSVDTSDFDNRIMYSHLIDDKNEVDMAFTSYYKALRIARNIKDSGIVYNDLGMLYRRESKYEKSEAMYKKALSIFYHGDSTKLNRGEILNYAITLDNLANLYAYELKPSLCKKYLLGAIALMKILPEPLTEYEKSSLANIYNSLGDNYVNEERSDSAYFFLDLSRNLNAEIIKKNDSVCYKEALAVSDGALALFYYSVLGNTDSANAYYKKAIEIDKSLSALFPSLYNYSLAEDYSGIADVFLSKNMPKEAKISVCKAIDLVSYLYALNNMAYGDQLVRLFNQLGDLFTKDNFPDSASYAYIRSVNVGEDLLLKLDDSLIIPDLAAGWVKLGDLHQTYIEGIIADSCFSRAIKLFEPFCKNKNADWMNELALIYLKYAGVLEAYDSNFTDAEVYIEKSIKTLKGLFYFNKMKYAYDLWASYLKLSDFECSIKKYNESKKAIKQASYLSENYLSQDSLKYNYSKNKIYQMYGRLYFSKRQYSESIRYLNLAMLYFEKNEPQYKLEIFQCQEILNKIGNSK